MNDDIKKLHETLMAQHQALYEKLDTITDPALAKAIVTELQEILHRVDVLQGLLFKQSSASLVRQVEKVEEADAALADALKSAESAADYITGVSKFLGFVDKAIDLAKTLAPMAV